MITANDSWTVIIGDVIDSRRITSPAEFHDRMMNLCDEINTRYRDSIFAGMKILKGKDEIGIVLSLHSNFYQVLSGIVEGLLPVRIRFAVASGIIDTALDKGDVSLMDGPAFHNAAVQMAALKKSRNLAVNVSVFKDGRDLLLEGYLNLLIARKNEWSLHQLRIIKKYRQGYKQREISECLGISQQAVSLALKSGQWHSVNEAEKRLNAFFNIVSGGFTV